MVLTPPGKASGARCSSSGCAPGSAHAGVVKIAMSKVVAADASANSVVWQRRSLQRDGQLPVPRAQVADSDSDDLRRPVSTQRRVRRRELVHHVLSTEAGVHQATDIQALVQRHLVT